MNTASSGTCKLAYYINVLYIYIYIYILLICTCIYEYKYIQIVYSPGTFCPVLWWTHCDDIQRTLLLMVVVVFVGGGGVGGRGSFHSHSKVLSAVFLSL